MFLTWLLAFSERESRYVATFPASLQNRAGDCGSGDARAGDFCKRGDSSETTEGGGENSRGHHKGIACVITLKGLETPYRLLQHRAAKLDHLLSWELGKSLQCNMLWRFPSVSNWRQDKIVWCQLVLWEKDLFAWYVTSCDLCETWFCFISSIKSGFGTAQTTVFPHRK